MINKIILNDLLSNARFFEHIKVGLVKEEIEQVLSIKLGKPDIDTPDISLYYIELEPGLVVSIAFDKMDVCYEINLQLEENNETDFCILLENNVEKIKEDISFEFLLDIFSRLNIEWVFDRKRVYLRTVCILLNNGLRLYYSFGNKDSEDYGLFSIKLILENHPLTLI